MLLRLDSCGILLYFVTRSVNFMFFNKLRMVSSVISLTF